MIDSYILPNKSSSPGCTSGHIIFSCSVLSISASETKKLVDNRQIGYCRRQLIRYIFVEMETMKVHVTQTKHMLAQCHTCRRKRTRGNKTNIDDIVMPWCGR